MQDFPSIFYLLYALYIVKFEQDVPSISYLLHALYIVKCEYVGCPIYLLFAPCSVYSNVQSLGCTIYSLFTRCYQDIESGAVVQSLVDVSRGSKLKVINFKCYMPENQVYQVGRYAFSFQTEIRWKDVLIINDSYCSSLRSQPFQPFLGRQVFKIDKQIETV